MQHFVIPVVTVLVLLAAGGTIAVLWIGTD